MFGKNYDEEISKIITQLNSNTKDLERITRIVNELQGLFGSQQENMINMSKNQAQQKAIVTFLVNHANVDSDAEEDLQRMMKEIIKFGKDKE